MEVTKSICYVKGESAVDHWMVQEILLGLQEPNDQAKTVDSKVVFQAIEANLASST